MLALSLTALVTVLPLLASAAPANRVKRATYQFIHPNGDTSRCLVAPRVGNDVALTIEDCATAVTEPTTSSQWDITFGDNPSIQISGTNYCLDAGVGPHNNGPAKLYTCYPGASQQDWYYTNDNRIAITGGNQCLDLGPNGPQTYQCTPGNTNQIWVAGPRTTAGVTTTVAASTTQQVTTTAQPVTTTTTTVATTTQAAPVASGVYIHPKGDTTRCLTADSGYAAIGTNLVIVGCLGGVGSFASLQQFDIHRGSGAITLAGGLGDVPTSRLCMDAGDNGAAGNPGKIFTCYPGLFQQTFYFTDDGRIAVQGGSTCLRVIDQDYITPNKPLGTLATTLFEQCTTGDNNEFWTISS